MHPGVVEPVAVDPPDLVEDLGPLGARVEVMCAAGPLQNGTEAAAAHCPAAESALHIALLNRGSLIAPFHNMMLISPATKKRQVARLIAAFDEVMQALFAPKDAP